MMLSYLLFGLLTFLTAAHFEQVVAQKSSTKLIVPGAVWTDNTGAPIDAHGGGIVKSNGTFYWIGEAVNSTGIRLYSSTDLVDWTSHGTVYDQDVSRGSPAELLVR